MRLGWLRLGVFAALVGVALASGYWVVVLHRQIDEVRREERGFTENAWAVTASLSELRAAQQAYVAAESDRAFWAEQAAAGADAALTGLAELSRLATAPGATRAIEAAAEAIGDLQSVDAASREHVAAGEQDLARDLLLSDAAEFGGEAASHVARALALERGTRDGAATRQVAVQARAFFAALGGAVLAALMMLAAALRRSDRDEEDAESEAADAAGDDAGLQPATGSSLLDLTLTEDSAADPVGPAPGDGAAPDPAVPELDLPAAAVICTDLGSLSSASELPDLLSRAATVLNASGMIVWVSDGSGEALRPAVGHGYSQAMLGRLGAIPHDSENATASAYREARMHVVPADSSGAGAIVAPLISSVHCFGVLSAELREGWEARRDVQSLTRIIAAQLATLVAPDAASPAGSQRAQA